MKKTKKKKGFHEDQATRRFCSVLILSAIDEARQKLDQQQFLSEEQINARYFLIARENRSMIKNLVECMGLDPDWFFTRVLRRLVADNWPALAGQWKHSSRLHGSGLYVFFDEDVAST